MTYRLRDNVSYCRVHDHLVFLDLHRDLYFRLPRHMEAVFLACLRGDTQQAADADELVRLGLVTSDSRAASRMTNPDRDPAVRSGVEEEPAIPRLDLPVAVEVLWIVSATQLQLKTRRLAHVIGSLVDHRQRSATGVVPATDGASLLQAASLFRRARLYVPIETRCLLDSLSLLRFLSRRHMYAKLVLGVSDDPFSAHCWVQAGGWVLNDTMGNAMAYTPIREI